MTFSKTPVVLWYSYRDTAIGATALFEDRIIKIQKQNPNFEVHFVNTAHDSRIAEDALRKSFGAEISSVSLYVCGPGNMVRQTSEQARAWGVPEQHITTEYFGVPELPSQESNDASFSISFQKVNSNQS